MPSARASTAGTVKRGVRRKARRAKRRSWSVVLTMLGYRWTRVRERMFDLSAALEAWRARTNAPVVVAAVRVNGRLAWTGGPADAPVPRLPTYSILKTFTAIAVLRLQEAGRVD